MTKTIKQVLWGLVFLAIPSSIFGQDGFFERHPISISIFTHSIGLPFRKVIQKPLNMGIAIGTEFNYSSNKSKTLHQGIQLGFYVHKHLSSSVYIKTEFISRVQNKAGLIGETSLAFGYIHNFKPTPVLKLSKEGTYKRAKDKGIGAIIYGASIGAGYNTKGDYKFGTSPFIKYNYLIETPYSRDFKSLPHSFLHLGSRIYSSDEN